MATIKLEDMSPKTCEEERHNIIAESVINKSPAIPGVETVRDITPLVMLALQLANNPYVTGKKGFSAMGIEFDGKNTNLDHAEFGIRMMPKTAEVLVLFSCDKDKLKQYATNYSSLENDALEFIESSTLESLAEATVYISERIDAMSKSRASKARGDEGTPEAAALREGGKGPKKLARTGSHKS